MRACVEQHIGGLTQLASVVLGQKTSQSKSLDATQTKKAVYILYSGWYCHGLDSKLAEFRFQRGE